MAIVFVATFNIVYFSAFITVNLTAKGLAESNNGYVLASQTATYLPLCILAPNYLSKIPRKFYFVIAF